ncbi:MAG: transcriptional repressor [Eubacteriaceae bacterium]|nr:transcriptional repressor [Eubacteriaceae bacterium]
MDRQRNTVQRQIILDTLKKLRIHPSIDEIYAEIHKEHASISKTTIYRNLRQLAKAGEIRQVLLADGLERYDSRTEQHYHFTCKHCGGILDINIEYLEGINDKVQGMYGVQVDEHDVIFIGVCQDCKEGEKAPNEEA